MDTNDDAVNELLRDIRTNAVARRAAAPEECVYIEKVKALPEPLRTAVLTATDDPDVPNPRLSSYVNERWPEAKISLTSVQRHRSKHGCHVCGWTPLAEKKRQARLAKQQPTDGGEAAA